MRQHPGFFDQPSIALLGYVLIATCSIGLAAFITTSPQLLSSAILNV